MARGHECNFSDNNLFAAFFMVILNIPIFTADLGFTKMLAFFTGLSFKNLSRGWCKYCPSGKLLLKFKKWGSAVL